MNGLRGIFAAVFLVCAAVVVIVGCASSSPKVLPHGNQVQSPKSPPLPPGVVAREVSVSENQNGLTSAATVVVQPLKRTVLAWDSAANDANPDSNLVYIVQARPTLLPSSPWKTIGVLPQLSCTVTSTNNQGYFRVIASNTVTGVTSPN